MQPSPIQHSISSTCLPFGLCHNHLHTRQLHKPLPSPLCPFTLQGVFFPPMDIQFLMLSLSHYSGKETNHIVRAAITVSCRQNWNPGSNHLCSPHIQSDSTLLCKPHDGLYNQLPVYNFSLICCRSLIWSTSIEQWLHARGFPGGAVVKNLPANGGDTRDTGSITGLGRSSGVENGNPLQYSCLKNSMDRGAWWATFMWLQGDRHDWTIEHYTPDTVTGIWGTSVNKEKEKFLLLWHSHLLFSFLSRR